MPAPGFQDENTVGCDHHMIDSKTIRGYVMKYIIGVGFGPDKPLKFLTDGQFAGKAELQPSNALVVAH